MTLRLVVTGSRKFTNERLVREWIFEAIDEWRATSEEARYSYIDMVSNLEWVTLIHWKARGFDTLAATVGTECMMTVIGIGAEWDRLDSSTAGTSRNVALILEGKPNFGLVGPGEYGTGHMTGLLRNLGIPFLYKGDQPIS